MEEPRTEGEPILSPALSGYWGAWNHARGEATDGAEPEGVEVGQTEL